MKAAIFLLLLAALPMSGAALELSLEENRGESGTIGYVDIDRVFKEYSGTLTAREEFLGDIRKKEEAISQRKTAIYTLKADIAKLRQEREFALTLPGLLKTREQLSQETEDLKAAAVAVASAAVSLQNMQAAAQEQAVSTDTVQAPAVSTDTVQAQAVSTDTVQAPAVSTDTVQAQAASTDTVQAQVSTAAVPGSTETARTPAQASMAAAGAADPPRPVQLPAVPELGIDMPGISRVPTSYFKFSVSTAVAEIDAAIAAREKELKEKEDALKLYQRQAETELLQYESRKSELILGRIYIALKELAVKEEVSVVVDKRSILFGHSAVDLTDKLISKLEESPI